MKTMTIKVQNDDTADALYTLLHTMPDVEIDWHRDPSDLGAIGLLGPYFTAPEEHLTIKLKENGEWKTLR
jgi:hypothetical protein